jgi:hypothetical protein
MEMIMAGCNTPTNVKESTTSEISGQGAEGD